VVATTTGVFRDHVGTTATLVYESGEALLSRELSKEDRHMSAAGTWNLVMQTPIGERKVTLTLQSAGGTLTGKMSAEGNSTDIYEGKDSGNGATWKVNVQNPMPLTLEFSGTVAGDQISGTVSAAVGSWPFSGSRSA